MNRHVATGFLGKLGGLGRDSEFSVATETGWPCVATENVMSRQGLGCY